MDDSETSKGSGWWHEAMLVSTLSESAVDATAVGIDMNMFSYTYVEQTADGCIDVRHAADGPRDN